MGCVCVSQCKQEPQLRADGGLKKMEGGNGPDELGQNVVFEIFDVRKKSTKQ